MLRCEVCKKEMKSVTNSHLRLHGLTTAEYKAQFPDAVLSHRNGVTAIEEYGKVVADQIKRRISEKVSKPYADCMSPEQVSRRKAVSSSAMKRAWSDPVYKQRVRTAISVGLKQSPKLIRKRGKTYDEIFGKDRSADIRSRQGVRISEATRGRVFTMDHRQNLSRALRVYNREHPEAGQASSVRSIQRLLTGAVYTRCKRGFVDGVEFQSSLEEQFLLWWKESFGDLKDIQRCTTMISYMYQGRNRRTLPDYVVVSEGVVCGIVEVKGNHLLPFQSTQVKLGTLLAYCSTRGLVPCLFTQNLLDANPEPSSPKSAMSVMYINMRNVVGEKVQRPGVEDSETNNTPVGVQNSSTPKRPAPIVLEVTNV